MGDGSSRQSFLASIKSEVTKLLDAISEDKVQVAHRKLEVLSTESAKNIAKSILEDRQRSNQELEVLKEQIQELVDMKVKTSSVGGSADWLEKELNVLEEKGAEIVEHIIGLDEKLKDLRD